MKVHLANAYPQMPRSYIPLVRELATQDRFGQHTLVDEPEAADLIWFVDARSDFKDWYLTRLRRHPLVRRFPERCMMYNEISNGWPALPGVFVSPPRSRFDRRRQRSCGYIVGSLNPRCEEPADTPAQRDLLYSFAGRPVCPMRHALMNIAHRRGLIEDTSGYNFFTGTLDERLRRQQAEYAHTIRRSSFVLCPRGIATSSYRAYESMAAGRCPVIISDEWVPPAGPDWEEFAVFVAEDEVGKMPQLLESLEDEAAQRGRLAREAYDEWFGPNVRFHRMIDWCGEVFASRRWPERVVQWLPNRQALDQRAMDLKVGAKRRIKRLVRKKAAPSGATA